MRSYTHDFLTCLECKIGNSNNNDKRWVLVVTLRGFWEGFREGVGLNLRGKWDRKDFESEPRREIWLRIMGSRWIWVSINQSNGILAFMSFWDGRLREARRVVIMGKWTRGEKDGFFVHTCFKFENNNN
jgi:hypothetical protein